MKQHRTRQRQNHRNQTPSVICLPAQLPPVSSKRSGSRPALSLPTTDEPLAYESRQVRRQKRRKGSNAAAVQSATTIPTADPVRAIESIAAIEPTMPVTSSVPLDVAPLPRNRALAAPRRSAIGATIAWLRAAMRRPVRRTLRETKVIDQLQALRDEVAALQISLDRTLDRMAV